MALWDLMSRRGILLGLGVAATGIATTEGSDAVEKFKERLGMPTTGGRPSAPLAKAEYRDWATHVGSDFVTHTGQVLTLVAVRGYAYDGERPYGLRKQAFSADFELPKGESMESAIYTVKHSNGSKFEMYLTSPGADLPTKMYAIFN